MSREETRTRLIAKGWKFGGCGRFSSVYVHPHKPLAVKVCAEWDAWPDYILWAHSQGQLGKGAPLVYSIQGQPWGYVAVMERLYPVYDYGRANALRPWTFSIKAWIDRMRGATGYRCGSDFGGSNCMQRGLGTDAQIVETDPIAGLGLLCREPNLRFRLKGKQNAASGAEFGPDSVRGAGVDLGPVLGPLVVRPEAGVRAAP